MFASNTAFATGDIKAKVIQWGLWSRGDGLGAAALRQGAGVSPDITDEEGVFFDGLVCGLKRADDRCYKVISGHYQKEKSYKELSIELNLSVGMIRVAHDNGLHWLDGIMNGVILREQYTASDVIAGLLGEMA